MHFNKIIVPKGCSFFTAYVVYRPIVKTISHLQGHSAALRLHVHLLNSVKSQLSLNDGTPHDSKTTYQAMITSASQTADATSVTAALRNVEQIRNTQKTQRNASRLSRDALYNLHEFGYDSDFIHRIVTYPDVSLTLQSVYSRIIFQSPLFQPRILTNQLLPRRMIPPSISVTFTSQFCSSGKQIFIPVQ